MNVILNCGQLLEREQAHAYLARMLDLPAYYGKNLDALYDCLTELHNRTIVLIGVSAVPRNGSYVTKILQVLEEAARANPGLTLELR